MLLESGSGHRKGVGRIPVEEGAGEPARAEEAQRVRQEAGGGIWRGERLRSGTDGEEECGPPARKTDRCKRGKKQNERHGKELKSIVCKKW